MTAGRPEFVDNREGNTMAVAIREHVGWISEHLKGPLDLAIASGYFNPAGYSAVAESLDSLAGVRILLGAEPNPPCPERRRRLGDPRGPRFENVAFREALSSLEKCQHDELNLLGFSEETEKTLRRLVAFLRSGRVQVRRYEEGFLHGKAFLFAGEEGVLAGSSNFTGGGLLTNLELNLGQYQPAVVGQVSRWFEDLWEKAKPYDLASLYDARYREYPPYLIYLRVLWEKYGAELEKEVRPGGRIPLTTFQDDGLARARRILDKYNGVIIADGVGLGKTFLAGRILQEATQEKRQHALLISPAALRDGTWEAFGRRFQLYLDNVSFEQLAADGQLGGTGGGHLSQHRDRYALVVIDEAHAFRNPDTERFRALRNLLRGTPPKKLVLVTATPVNNSLWDLYNLLTLFVPHDGLFADLGIPSLRGRFDKAAGEDPYDLKPEVLFDLLDQVVVRRTRHFVTKHYPDQTIKMPDGTEMRIRFPEPVVRKLEYEIDGVLPGFFAEFAKALAPEGGQPGLTLARYVPSAYLKRGEPEASQQALAGLLRSALLKRFESSVHSFAETADRMSRAHDLFLQALDKGRILKSELIAEWDEDTATDRKFDEFLEEREAERADRYDVVRLRQDIARDRDLMRGFVDKARKVTRASDPKLAALSKALLNILGSAKRDAGNPDEHRELRKVVIFTYFEDTVDWIEEYLRDLFDKDKRFAEYRGRLASAAGSASRTGITREAAIFGFAPKSTEAPAGRDEDLYDVIVATDVLAEGLNLQQCRNIINFDLPWNPMRLVQRHGRIDRIGSPHEKVFIGCFFPGKQLDTLLNLEEHLRRKIAQAAAAVGVEGKPLPGIAEQRPGEFTDTRDEIKRLRQERPDLFVNAGEDPDAHSGEEYRQELRKAMEKYGDQIKALPWAAGSGFVGKQRGHLFCARVFDRVFLRFVPADGSEMLKDTIKCLRAICCEEQTPRSLPVPLLGGVHDAWRKARKDIFDDWAFATDPKNLQPSVRPLFREMADHLRSHPPEGLTQAEIEDTLAAIEAPWRGRVEREFRAVFKQELPAKEKSKAIVDKVREIGLQPYHAPQPLEPIDLEEVDLVCWMAVDVSS